VPSEAAAPNESGPPSDPAAPNESGPPSEAAAPNESGPPSEAAAPNESGLPSDPAPPTESAEAGESGRRVLSLGVQARDAVPVISAMSGAAALISGPQPTGNLVADVVLTAGFAAGIAWLGTRARLEALPAAALAALFFSGFGLPAAALALVAAGTAIAIAPGGAGRRMDADTRTIGACLSAALTTHACLDLPDVGFSLSASLLAAVALSPIVVTGYQALPAGHRRLVHRIGIVALAYAVVASVLAAIVAFSVRDRIETAIDDAENGITAIEQGDRPQAIALLDTARAGFEQSGSRLGGVLTWPSRIVPVAAQHSRALETAAEQGEALATTAARTVNQADVEKIRGQNGAIDLAVVDSVNTELNLANRTMTEARAALQQVNTPWLLPQLGSRLETVDEELAATGADIDLANHATSVLPGILGANGQRRYLVLFVQPAESREFGGFVGAYGLLEVADGRFNLAESGSINTDFGRGEATLSAPEELPLPYVRVLPEINPQNLTAIADLASIADAALELAPQWRENPEFELDGVITMDPYALAAMLELTGPITIAERAEPLDSENVVDFLLRDQYEEFGTAGRDVRQDTLRVLAGSAFDRLLSVEIPGPERLGAIFGPAARADRLAMITTDPFENAFFDRIFLSANMPEVGSAVDMVGIYSQTATASKLDGYAHRSIEYDVTVDPATGEVVGQLEIVDRNDAPADADDFVLGLDSPPGPDGEPVEVGDNFLVLGLYTRAEVAPFSSDGRFGTGEALPAFSYFRHPVSYVVPLGGSTTVSTTLTSTVEPGRYDVFLPAQATANPIEVTLTVRPTSGWRVDAPDARPDGSVSRTFVLDEAMGFTYLFAQTG